VTAPFLTAFVAVVALAFADGGYPPAQWGLAIICFVLVGVTALIVSDPPWPNRLELAFLAGLVAFTLWTGVSTLWSPGASAPIFEAERNIVYVAAFSALLLLPSRRSPGALTAGVLAAAVVVSFYGLCTRLFPGSLGGTYDPSGGEQLGAPIGYSNALGLLATIGIVLAAGVAAHGRSVANRALAAAALVVLGPTLYFSFSRGSLVALGAGLLLQVAVDPRRGRLLGSAFLAAPAALAVLMASRSALAAPAASLETAREAGQQLAAMLLLLGLAAAAFAPLLHGVEQRIRPGPLAGRVLAIALAASAVAAGAAAIAVAGGPVALVQRGADAFGDTQPSLSNDLDERLFSVSGSGRADYWRVAWSMFREDPLLGSGAGSYEAHWLRDRPASFAFDARDAHNLYLETLAELGPVGLALLIATLTLPLVGLARARRRRFAAAAGGAYAAFLVHAGVDWDWEVPALTVAALVSGAALLAWSRGNVARETMTGARRRVALVLALPVTAIALAAHVGNRAVAASEAATSRGEPVRGAAEARRARAWAPWSHEPWQRLGEAELALGRDASARVSLLRALELDPENWLIWYDLSLVSRGEERARALERVITLNPLSPEAEEIQTKP